MALAEYGNAFNIDTDANGDPILIDAQSGQTVATYDRTQSAWVYGDIISDSVNTEEATIGDRWNTIFEYRGDFNNDTPVIIDNIPERDTYRLTITGVRSSGGNGMDTNLRINGVSTEGYHYQSISNSIETFNDQDEIELIQNSNNANNVGGSWVLHSNLLGGSNRVGVSGSGMGVSTTDTLGARTCREATTTFDCVPINQLEIFTADSGASRISILLEGY